MLHKEHIFRQQINDLREREKELRCLYKVEELISKELPFDQFFYRIITLIPYGWQFPEICKVKITYEGTVFKEPGWEETEWKHAAEIEVDDKVIGKIEVFYTRFRKFHVDSPFLPEEFKLLNTISNLISNYIFSRKLANTLELLQREGMKRAPKSGDTLAGENDVHWKWRLRMVEAISTKLDLHKYGIRGLYLIGSTKEATAGPASDIDLLIHVNETAIHRDELIAWFEGWSLCLSEINFTRTGYETDGLIDIHIITDEDIKNKTSYAVMIGSINNSAKPIKVIE